MSVLSYTGELIGKITTAGERCTFTGRTMHESFSFYGPSIFRCNSLTFENTDFTNQVFISDQPLGTGVKFINCHFNGTVTLRNIIASGEDLVFDFEKRSVIFENCVFNKRVELIGDKFDVERGVYLKKCTFSNGLFASDCKIGPMGLWIVDCIINVFFSLKKCIEASIYLKNCTVDSVLEIEHCELDSITFSDCNVKDDLFIQNTFFKNGVSFYEGEYSGEIRLEHNAGATLSLRGAMFSKTVDVSHHDFEKVEDRKFDSLAISNCAFANGFYLTGLNKLLPVGTAEMRSVLINCSALLQGDIYLENLKINLFTLDGFNAKANIVLTNLSVNELSLNNFHNYSQLVLNNIRALSENSSVSIVGTTLGKASLFQVNFRRFREIKIRDVVLSEIVTSNVDWFDRKQVSVSDFLAPVRQIDEFGIRRELYRQLKFAMEKNGDRPQSLLFQSFEMDYYRQFLNLRSKKNRVDRFILWTSQSNKFGQNWWRPTWMLLVTALIFYIPVAFCASDLVFRLSLNQHDFFNTLDVLFWRQLRIYPQLLNPTHNLSNVVENIKNKPGSIYFFDFLHRLFTTYYIFQIVTAFRKYIR